MHFGLQGFGSRARPVFASQLLVSREGWRVLGPAGLESIDENGGGPGVRLKKVRRETQKNRSARVLARIKALSTMGGLANEPKSCLPRL